VNCRKQVEIYKKQRIHFPIDTAIVASIWNQHGNRIRKFIDKWLVKDAEFKSEKNDVWAKWLGVSIAEKFPAKNRNKFFDDFEEILGMSSTKIRFSDTITVWGYRGFRIRKDEEADTWEQNRIDKDHAP